MKTFVSLLVALFGVGLGMMQVVYAGDVISPPLLSYTVEPGEKFSFDLVFKSEEGGEYDVFVNHFWFDDDGTQKFELADDGVVQLSRDLESFALGEDRYIPVSVRVPEDQQDGDLQYMVVFKKHSEAFHKYELAAVVLLSVGESPQASGEIQDASWVFAEDDFDSIRQVGYQFVNTGSRFIECIPRLVLLGSQSEVLRSIEGQVKVFFPSRTQDAALGFLMEENVEITDEVQQVLFQVLSSSGELLDQAELDIPVGKLLLASEQVESPVKAFRERRRFSLLYHPIFRGFALLIGLTLVAGTFFIRRKTS